MTGRREVASLGGVLVGVFRFDGTEGGLTEDAAQPGRVPVIAELSAGRSAGRFYSRFAGRYRTPNTE